MAYIPSNSTILSSSPNSSSLPVFVAGCTPEQRTTPSPPLRWVQCGHLRRRQAQRRSKQNSHRQDLLALLALPHFTFSNSRAESCKQPHVWALVHDLVTSPLTCCPTASPEYHEQTDYKTEMRALHAEWAPYINIKCFFLSPTPIQLLFISIIQQKNGLIVFYCDTNSYSFTISLPGGAAAPSAPVLPEATCPTHVSRKM